MNNPSLALPSRSSDPDAPLSGRTAGGVVVAGVIGNLFAVTPAVIVVFGVFLVPIATEFHWPRAKVSFALALVSIAMAIGSPLAGRLCDEIGVRRVALCGTLMTALTVLSLHWSVANPALFYLQFAVIGVAGALTSGVIYAKLLAEWFETRRGLWIGIAGGVGNGLGATLMPMLAGALLMTQGWRGAFVGIGASILLIGLPIQWLFLRDPPARSTIRLDASQFLSGHAPDFPIYEGLTASEAWRTLRFWLLLTSLPIGGGVILGLFAIIVPLVLERGFSIQTATGVIATISLTCTVWEPTVGYILDRSNGGRILAPLYWIAAGGIIVLLTAGSPLLMLGGGVMIGLGLGAEFSALSFLLSRYFGRRALGTIAGIGVTIQLAAGALATVLLNAAYDAGIGYRTSILFITPFLVWNGLALLFLGRYPYTAANDVKL